MNKLCQNGFAFLLACLAAAIPAHAVEYTWTGLSTRDFNTAGNWNPEGVPNSSDDAAVIQDGVSDLGTSNTVSTLTLGGDSTSGTINLNLGGNLTASQVIQSGTGTVNFNGGTITASAASADFLSGTTNYIFSGGATVDTQSYSVTISTALAKSTGSTGISINPGGGLTKQGAGILTLTGMNSYIGATSISAGVLQADDGVGLPASSLLRLDGGVLQCNSSVFSFSRNLGTSGGDFQWTTNGGGFSNGDTGTWNISVNGGGTLYWGDGQADVGSKIVGTLKLSSPYATGAVTIKNNIDLGDSDRTIEVNNPDTGGTHCGTLTGTITGTGGIIKNGPGRLMMNGNNCLYTGTTTLNEGFFANYASHQPTGNYVVNGGTMCFCGKSPDSIAGLKVTGGEVEGLGGSILSSKTNYDIQGGELYGITLTNYDSIVVGLTKTGDTVATLECTCTYTGPTTISEGTLVLSTTTDDKYTGQISTSSLIENNATFLIDDTKTHIVGTISGTGTTQLIDGAQLTATSITQDTLIIGAVTKLTIATMTGGATSEADSLSPVPEPGTLVLLATAGLAVLLTIGCGKMPTSSVFPRRR
ncbi:MAG: autotransporter-associated beta strand repeat-containing protein [Thermoguttaceae bacterium]|jgi:autotransporter-associated beta strand protein